MTQAEFEIAMECPLGGDTSPKEVFEQAIVRLRAAGAEITSEGEQVIAYLLALGTTAASMRGLTAVFHNAATVHSVLKEGAQRMKREAKYAAKKNPPPPADGAAEQPGAGE